MYQISGARVPRADKERSYNPPRFFAFTQSLISKHTIHLHRRSINADILGRSRVGLDYKDWGQIEGGEVARFNESAAGCIWSIFFTNEHL